MGPADGRVGSVSRRLVSLFAALALLISQLAFQIPAIAQEVVFTVNTSDDVDDGSCDTEHCSLREAVNAANANADFSSIHFDIGEGGVATITVSSALPTITQPVTIDGTTQPDYNGAPLIDVKGGDLEGTVTGLALGAGSDGSTIRGLEIFGFTGPGVGIFGSGSNLVYANAIHSNLNDGVQVTTDGNSIGFQGVGNILAGNTNAGVLVTGSGNTIDHNLVGTSDGTTAWANGTNGVRITGANNLVIDNLISGNSGPGVRISNTTATGNLLYNNVIGLNTAEDALPNAVSGVLIQGSATQNTIGGIGEGQPNTISGNTGEGVLISGASDNDVIGNFIGTDPSGSSDRGNSGPGIGMASASGNTIRGNVMSGNDGNGVFIHGSDSNVVDSNLIGINAAGTNAVANSLNGVQIIESANNVIGGSTASARNVVSGNSGEGIRIDGANATNNRIEGNYLGTSADGLDDLGNAASGIYLRKAPGNLVIGNVVSGNNGFAGIAICGNPGGFCGGGDPLVGIVQSDAAGNIVEFNLVGIKATNLGALGNSGHGVSIDGAPSTDVSGNTIANSGQAGVRIFNTGAVGNQVLQNSIHSNGGLGIDLGAAGVTPNDADDVDTGPNNLQNFPVIASAVSNGTTTEIEGTLLSAQDSDYTIEFFANDVCDGSLHGEGQQFLASTVVTTNADGHAAIAVSHSAALAAGTQITATATDSAGNTSEFSACEPVEAAQVSQADVSIAKVDSPDPVTEGQVLTYTLDVANLGSNDATGVTVTDSLPGGVSVESITPSQGTCQQEGLQITCDLGVLTFSAEVPTTAQVVIEVRPASPGTLTNLASVSAVEDDPDTSNNAVDVETHVNAVDELNSPDAFGAGATVINFEDQQDGAHISDQYASFGVTFVDDETTTPLIIGSEEVRGGATHSPPNSLSNDADTPEPGSAGVPLTMHFDPAVRRVGFFVGNGADAIVGTLTAYDAEGNVVGSVFDPIEQKDVTEFLGIVSDQPISTVELDYGNTLISEEIDDLWFEPSPVEGLSLTVEEDRIPAGIALVPFEAVPPEEILALLEQEVEAAPVGSIPVGSIPVGSIPVGSIPVGSIPVGSIPVGSIPVGSIGLDGGPAGLLDDVLISSIPADWESILAGTSLAGLVRQTVTLGQVYADPGAKANFEALTLAETGLGSTLLRGLPLSTILLGSTPLNDVPVPVAGATWCDLFAELGYSCSANGLDPASDSLVGASIAAAPVGSIPVGSIPVGSIFTSSVPVGSIPVGSIPVGSIDILITNLRSVPVGSIPNHTTVVDCSLVDCLTATLGDAFQAGAIFPDATLADLGQMILDQIPLWEIIIGLLPRSFLPWAGVSPQGLQPEAGTGDLAHYRAEIAVACLDPILLLAEGLENSPDVTISLPPGFLPQEGTSQLAVDGGDPFSVADPVQAEDGSWQWPNLPAGPCGEGAEIQELVLTFAAFAGLEIGAHTSELSILTSSGLTDTVGGQAPIEVLQNWEGNDSLAEAPAIPLDTLVIGHVAHTGDQEVFRLQGPFAANTVVTVELSQIPEEADFDLVIGPAGEDSVLSNPVGSIPVGSIPIEDSGWDLSAGDDGLPPETLQDIPVGSIPVGSIPVGSISANRGNTDEVARIRVRSPVDELEIQVSGYAGSFSSRNFVLLGTAQEPPPLPSCPARTFAHQGDQLSSSLPDPGSVLADRQTLFLVASNRLADLYGAAEVTPLMGDLATVAGRDEVKGLILEVDADSGVQAALQGWDQDPCSIAAANQAVAEIIELIDQYRSGLPDLSSIVLVGSDEALPMLRVEDPVFLSPETDYAAELAFTTDGLTKGNALYAAAAQGYFLSDHPYGARQRILWRDNELYLPQEAVGRLVETPAEMSAQLTQYLLSNGLLESDAYTAGGDFLSDGSEAVAQALAARVGPDKSTKRISDTWTAADLAGDGYFSDPPAIGSVNAHYNHYQLQPWGVPDVNNVLIDTGALTGSTFSDRLVFTFGCHSGLNVADTLVPGSSLDQLDDWAQAYARTLVAAYVAQTGFAYGDTEASALTERLMSVFAGNLADGHPHLGARWVAALDEYFATMGTYDDYDFKVLMEANFFGLPFYRFAGDGPASGPPPLDDPTHDPVIGLDTFSVVADPALVADTSSDRGTRYVRQTDHPLDGEGDEWAPYRNIVPRFAFPVPEGADGILIRELTTADQAPTDLMRGTPIVALGEQEPESDHTDVLFPANFVNLAHSPGDTRAVIMAMQARPGPDPGSDLQIPRLVTHIRADVLYGSVDDTTPPLIREVNAVTGTSSTTFQVRAVDADAGLAGVAVLYLAGGDGTWTFLQLSAGADAWTGTASVSGDVQYIAMAWSEGGRSAFSTFKGLGYVPVLASEDSDGPEILIESPTEGAVFTLNEVVPAQFFCSDPAGVLSCVGSSEFGQPIDTSTVGVHTFQVIGTDLAGNSTTETRTYFVQYDFEGFFPPVDNPPVFNLVRAGRSVAVKWSLRDAAGVSIGDLSAVTSIASRIIDCDSGAPSSDVADTDPAGESGLRYDPDTEQFVFSWQTNKDWSGSCRELLVILNDGTIHTVLFEFR